MLVHRCVQLHRLMPPTHVGGMKNSRCFPHAVTELTGEGILIVLKILSLSYLYTMLA